MSNTTVRSVCGVEYTLTRKRVKNINLRIKNDLTVAVSAGATVPAAAIDAFVASKKGWIASAKAGIQQKSRQISDAEKWSDDECLKLFSEISDRIYPAFEGALKCKPTLKVRLMKSRWGVCHIRKNTVTLNKALMDKPLEAIEYVILHEYVHFIHPNHQAPFHQAMQTLMPDYRERKKLLSDQ